MGRPSKNIAKHFHALHILNGKKYPKKLKRQLLESKEVVNAISEIVLNILHKIIPLQPGVKLNRRVLEGLACKKTSRKKKQALLLSGRGGFVLSSLLSAALPIIARILGDGISSR